MVSVARLSSREPTRLSARRSLHNIAAETEHARESALCCCSEKRGGSATGYSSLVSLYPFPSNPRFSSPTSSRGEDARHTAQRRAPLRHRCLSRISSHQPKKTRGKPATRPPKKGARR